MKQLLATLQRVNFGHEKREGTIPQEAQFRPGSRSLEIAGESKRRARAGGEVGESALLPRDRGDSPRLSVQRKTGRTFVGVGQPRR